MRIITILLAHVFAMPAYAQERDLCLVSIISSLKDLKIIEARKAFYSGKCEYRYRDDFGEEKEVNPDTLKGLIEGIDFAEKRCQQIKEKGDRLKQDDLRDISSICGTGRLGYSALADAEKYSGGVPITDIAKKWDAFIAETKAAWAQKKQDTAAQFAKSEAERKAQADTPEAYRESACYSRSIIETAKKSIADEKEVGKVSGIIDQSRLHEAGQFIITYTRELERNKKQYRAKTGREWTPSLCKK